MEREKQGPDNMICSASSNKKSHIHPALLDYLNFIKSFLVVLLLTAIWVMPVQQKSIQI